MTDRKTSQFDAGATTNKELRTWRFGQGPNLGAILGRLKPKKNTEANYGGLPHDHKDLIILCIKY